VTRTAGDEYVFKAPTLRNVHLTPPCFHPGKVWDLPQAVQVMGAAQLGMEVNPAEVESLVTFLGSLSGRQPAVQYPVLPPQTADTPLPDMTVGGQVVTGAGKSPVAPSGPGSDSV